MSIYAYTGMPGSGKSYDVVANQILPALKSGRRVVTNIPLYEEKIRAAIATGDLVEFPIETIAASPEKIWEYATPGTVLVLDEVWRLWPSGQKSNQVPEPFRKLLAEHRHMVDEKGDSMQVVLVTQDLAQIGAFARQLVESTFNHTKLTAVGARNHYRVDIYQGPQSGPNPPKNARLREIFGKYDKKIFSLYQSHTMSESKAAGANEVAADTRANIWKRPFIWIGLAGVIAGFAWGIPTAVHAIKDPMSDKQKAVLGADKQKSGSSSIVGAAKPAIVQSVWRVSGYVRFGGDWSYKSRAWITDGVKSFSLPLKDCRVQDFGELSCLFDGAWWSESGRKYPAASKPL